MALQIRMLGGFEVSQATGTPVEIPARKARALLALLARRPGQPIEREVLADKLWPEAPAERARTSLRQALKQLRRRLGPVIRSKGDALMLDPATVEVDVATFERLCKEASPPALARALVLYQGEFVDGFSAPAETLEEWLVFERASLRELALGALGRLAGEQSGAGATEVALRAAIRLLALEPLHEPMHRLLMQLYLNQGRRGDAAAQYRLCTDILRRELGVAPEFETQRLYHSITAGAETPTSVSEPAPIAVLPFRNLGDQPDQIYFSDGLTEDIMAALTRFRSIPVIARHSSFAVRDHGHAIEDAGRALGARYILSGSVRRHGERVRVTVQLADCETGTQLWAEHYDRDMGDIFAVQDDITRTVAAYVAPEVARAELKRSAAKPSDHLDAWDFVLRGMARIHEGTPEGSAAARRLFREALSIRPDYPEALAGLAMTYKIEIIHGVAPDRAAAARAAMTAARRAIALDPASALAHQELSTAYQLLNRVDEALAEVRIAVELNPYDPIGLHQLGNKADLYGDPRGVGWMEQAQRLNPLDVHLHTRLTFLARAYLNAGEPDQAAERARLAITRRADYAPAHYILALALGETEQIREARAALARAKALQPGLVAERRSWTPYRDPARNARLHEMLARLEDSDGSHGTIKTSADRVP